MEIEQPLTQERYVHYLENKNERSEEAFTNLYSAYKAGFANTIAAVLMQMWRQVAFCKRTQNTVLLWKQHWMAEILIQCLY